MKKLGLISLSVISSCLGADKSIDIEPTIKQSALSELLTQEMLKFQNYEAEYKKWSNKLEKLSTNTQDKIKKSLDLSNEQAREKAYEKAQKWVFEKTPYLLELLSLEKSLLDQNIIRLSSPNTPPISIGHILYQKVIYDRQDYKKILYPLMRDTFWMNMYSQARWVKRLNDYAKNQQTQFTKEELKRLSVLLSPKGSTLFEAGN